MKRRASIASYLAAHWKAAGVAVTVIAAGAGGYSLIKDVFREGREHRRAERQEQSEILKKYDFTPLILDNMVAGRDAGLYGVNLPADKVALPCIIRLEDTRGDGRDVFLEHCSASGITAEGPAEDIALDQLQQDVFGAYKADTLILDDVLVGKAPGLYGISMASRAGRIFCITRIEDMDGDRVDILPGFCMKVPAP